MTSTLLRDTGDDGRFWYWRGASGRRYIHSVYPSDACPPLPGAIYVAVRRVGSLRTAVGAGRFSVFWDLASKDPVAEALAGLGANEVHVHLLATSEEMARSIFADIELALSDADRASPHCDGVSLPMTLAA